MGMNRPLPAVFQPGTHVELGSHEFTPDEIVRFASQFDPQPFHLDAKAAVGSVFGALCASGWHTASVWMRKMRDYQASEAAQAAKEGLPAVIAGPSPGFRNLKWLKPVYAGDTVSYFYETVSSRLSASKPGWYVVTGRNGGSNQKGELVLEFESTALLRVGSA